jgi:glyoxylase-like metal-dependent hydrolase (beta-lactamase superfamily II)
VRENILRNTQPGASRVVFNSEASVFLGGAEVRAYYFGRGHTNGDYANGASAVEWVSVLDTLLALDFDIVIPGHGALLTKERVRTDGRKLVAMNERMAALARRPVPLDQVFDGLKLADLGWDRTVRTVAFKGGLKGYCDEMKAVR